MFSALEAIKQINKVRKDSIVVSTMTPNRYWVSVSESPELDLPIYGAMGKASSVCLGLAIAQPDRDVIVLDGDGALLMNLGSLVTIADRAATNLVLFVFEDGVYYTTGGQSVPGSGKTDFSGLAKASGFNGNFKFDNLEDFVSELPGIFTMEGPVLVCLKVFHEIPSGVYMGSTNDAASTLSKALNPNLS